MRVSKSAGRAVAAAAVAVVSTGAEATTQTINISLSQLLGNGGGFSGAFDISSFLAPSAGSVTHQLVGATVTAYGYSDAQYNSSSTSVDQTISNGGYQYFVQTGGGYYVSQTCGSWWSGYYDCGYYVPPQGYNETANYQTTYRTNSQTDTVTDTMTLSVGEGHGSGSDSAQPTSLTAYGYAGQSQTGSYASGYTVTTYDDRNALGGTFGALLASAVLTENDLEAANHSGLVNFTVGASGSFHLQNAELSFEVSDVAPVPEPATWAMLVGGFGAAGWSIRQDRRKKKTAALG